MHNHIFGLIFLSVVCFSHNLIAQEVYLDLDNNVISAQEFRSLQYSNIAATAVEMKNDTTYRSLIPREKSGYLGKSVNDSIWTILQSNADHDLSDLDFVTIKYHHGVVRCGGNWTASMRRRKMKELLSDLSSIGKTAFVYYHFDNKELKRHNEVAEHHQDVNGYIAELMLGGHAICASHIFLSKDGYFRSVVGETGYKYLGRVAKDLYNFNGEFTRVDGRPVHIIGIVYIDEYGQQVSAREYDLLKKTNLYKENIRVVHNIKQLSLIKI